MANENGLRLSLGTVAAVIGLLAQLGAFVWWAATENAKINELERRFNAATVDIEKDLAQVREYQIQKNATQDANISKLDEGGSRKVTLLEERLQALQRRVDLIEQVMAQYRGQSELTRAIAQQALDLARESALKAGVDRRRVEHYEWNPPAPPPAPPAIIQK